VPTAATVSTRGQTVAILSQGPAYVSLASKVRFLIEYLVFLVNLVATSRQRLLEVPALEP